MVWGIFLVLGLIVFGLNIIGGGEFIIEPCSAEPQEKPNQLMDYVNYLAEARKQWLGWKCHCTDHCSDPARKRKRTICCNIMYLVDWNEMKWKWKWNEIKSINHSIMIFDIVGNEMGISFHFNVWCNKIM